MKVILLFPQDKKLPDTESFTEYCPTKAAYMDDEYIPGLKEVLKKKYLDRGGRMRMLLVLMESLFYTLPYISKKESGKYTLRSLVRLKKEELRDYDIELYSNINKYNDMIKQFEPTVVDLTDVIRTQQQTHDPAVELFYYPKEVIDAIEAY